MCARPRPPAGELGTARPWSPPCQAERRSHVARGERKKRQVEAEVEQLTVVKPQPTADTKSTHQLGYSDQTPTSLAPCSSAHCDHGAQHLTVFGRDGDTWEGELAGWRSAADPSGAGRFLGSQRG